jgi:hypothetical protein
MRYQFGDRSEEHSRAAQIRSLFIAGTTIAEHAELCVEKGIWTDSELRGMASMQARTEVREALGKIMPNGAPFAGPTPGRKEASDGKNRVPIWKQMEFWLKVDFDYNYSAYKRRERANGNVAASIARVCIDRYGVEPNFIEEEEEPEVNDAD